MSHESTSEIGVLICEHSRKETTGGVIVQCMGRKRIPRYLSSFGKHVPLNYEFTRASRLSCLCKTGELQWPDVGLFPFSHMEK